MSVESGNKREKKMTKKNGSRSADLYAELLESISQAERTVVAAAVECVPMNEEVHLHNEEGNLVHSGESLVAAVRELNTLTAAAKTMERISKKSKSAVASEPA